MPIRLTDPLSYDGVFSLADRHGLTVYDAAYLDLREGLLLASLDNELCKAAGNSGVAFVPAISPVFHKLQSQTGGHSLPQSRL